MSGMTKEDEEFKVRVLKTQGAQHCRISVDRYAELLKAEAQLQAAQSEAAGIRRAALQEAADLVGQAANTHYAIVLILRAITKDKARDEQG